MKNLKNILATLVLVTVMGVSSSFGGVYIMDRSVTSDTKDQTVCTPEPKDGGVIYNTGIMIINLTGIMIINLTSNDAAPCTNGGGVTNEGIMIIN